MSFIRQSPGCFLNDRCLGTLNSLGEIDHGLLYKLIALPPRGGEDVGEGEEGGGKGLRTALFGKVCEELSGVALDSGDRVLSIKCLFVGGMRNKCRGKPAKSVEAVMDGCQRERERERELKGGRWMGWINKKWNGG